MGTDDNVPVVFPRVDDPEHNRLRRMMTRDFTFRRAEEMRPQIQKLVDGFLDDMIEKGPPADLVRDFALAGAVVGDLAACSECPTRTTSSSSTTAPSDSTRDRPTRRRRSRSGTIFDYVIELVGRKQREPGDDLMSRLITEHVATGAAEPRDRRHERRDPAAGRPRDDRQHDCAWERWRCCSIPSKSPGLRETDDPALIANVVEELMRYLSIVHSQVERVALEDLTIAGQLIRAGEYVLMNLPAGNWDAAFVAAPRARSTSTGTPAGTWASASACTNSLFARDRVAAAVGDQAGRRRGSSATP